MAGISVLPASIRLELDGTSLPKIVEAMHGTSNQIKNIFDNSFSEIGKLAKSALTLPRNLNGSLNLPIEEYRKAARESENYAQALREISNAATASQDRLGNLKQETRAYVAGINAAARAEEDRSRGLREQIGIYEKLQVELAKVNSAQAARPDFRSGAQRLLAGDTSVDQAVIAGASLESVMKRIASAGGVASGELAKVRAEAAQAAASVAALHIQATNAAESGLILNSIYANTAQEFGHTTKSASESASVFQQMFAAEEKLAASAKAYAADLELVRHAIDPTRVAQQQLDQELARADVAFEKGAIDARQYGLAVNAAADNFQRATVGGENFGNTSRKMSSQLGNLRIATLQAGQQMQDIGISLYSGQRAGVVFAQQLPQLAFALSFLEGSTNKTHDRIGKFATFLSGPWGLAVGLAVGVGAELISSFISAGDEAEKSGKDMRSFSEILLDQKSSWEKLTESVQAYNAEQKKAQTPNIQEMADIARGTGLILDRAIALRQELAAKLEDAKSSADIAANSGDVEGVALTMAVRRKNSIDAQITANNSRIDTFSTLAANIKGQIGQELGRLATDPRYAIDERLRKSREELNKMGLPTKQLGIAMGLLAERAEAAKDALNKSTRATSDGVDRFRTREQAIGIAGREFQRDGLDVSGNSQFRITSGHGNNAYHNRYKIDVDVPGAVDGSVTAPDIRAKYDAIAKRYAARGYRVIWSGTVYEPDGTTHPYNGQNQHYGHMDIEAPQAIVGKPKQLGVEGLANLQARNELKDTAAFERESKQWTGILENIGKQAEGVRDLGIQEDRRLEIQGLFARGQGAEAEKLQRQYELMDRLGVSRKEDLAVKLRSLGISDAEQKAMVDNLAVRRAQTRELEKQSEAQNRQLQLLAQTKDNISHTFYDLFKGGGFGAIADGFKRQWDLFLQNMADSLTESLFGDFFRDRKDEIFQGVKDSSDAAAPALNRFTGAVVTATQALGAIPGQPVPAGSVPANDNSAPRSVSDIVVEGHRRAAKAIKEALGLGLKAIIGKDLYDKLGDFGKGVAANAAFGTLGGGLVGATGFAPALGGILGGGLGKVAGDSILKGATSVFGKTVGNILGPLGGVLGGVLGGLFGGAKKGSASVSNSGIQLAGNNTDARSSASKQGDSIQASISRIAAALGGTVGNYGFTIGQRNDEFRVSGSTGADVTSKNPGNLLYKGKDAEEAARVALLNAIQDGAIKGIRQGAQRLLQAGKDLETQIAKALKFNDVFDQLDAIKDPVGSAVRKLNKEFEDLISIFKEAGASTEEWGQLEELYGLKRAEVIKQQTEATKQANEAMVSSLKDLIAQLEIGDSGLSLRDRLSNAHAVYDPLAAAVASGQKVDYDKFTAAARDVIDIARQLYGSQQEYFDTYNQVLGLSKQALGTASAGAASINTDNLPGSPSFTSAANDNSSLLSGLSALGLSIGGGTSLADLQAQLAALNNNIGTLIEQGVSSGSIVPTTTLAAVGYY